MGGRFCSFDQTHLECEWNLVEIQVLRLSPKSSEDQKNKNKKVFTDNWKIFFP